MTSFDILKYSTYIFNSRLKQLEDKEDKLKSDLREMNKPLARYADDQDLERELRGRDREEDPMLEYMKKKEIKEGKREPGIIIIHYYFNSLNSSLQTYKFYINLIYFIN